MNEPGEHNPATPDQQETRIREAERAAMEAVRGHGGGLDAFRSGDEAVSHAIDMLNLRLIALNDTLIRIADALTRRDE